MKSRLEKLEEFADWACKEHFKLESQCLRLMGFYLVGPHKEFYVVQKEFDFHHAQYQRWSKWREYFRKARKQL